MYKLNSKLFSELYTFVLYFVLRHSTSRTLVSDDWNLYTKNAIEVRDSIPRLAARWSDVLYNINLYISVFLDYLYPISVGVAECCNKLLTLCRIAYFECER